MNKIKIFTDGSSRGNPGPGGYGIVLKYNEKEKEIFGGFRKTTNNRMELLAVIIGLENIKTKDHPIEIYSDSKYVIDSITKRWVNNWKLKGFKGKKNKDLWLRYLEVQTNFTLTFHWVKGHAGHPENERCDVLAYNAASNNPTEIDTEFEKAESDLFGI